MSRSPKRVGSNLVLSGLLLTLLAGCGDGPMRPPSSGVHRGIIEFGGESRTSVPATARVGEPVTIVIETWGGPSLAFDRAETRVSVSGSRVLIEPWDTFDSPGAMPSIHWGIPHTQTLEFSEAGRVEVSVRGMSGPPYREVTRRFWVDVLE